jgi:hypothetical protein
MLSFSKKKSNYLHGTEDILAFNLYFQRRIGMNAKLKIINHFIKPANKNKDIISKLYYLKGGICLVRPLSLPNCSVRRKV